MTRFRPCIDLHQGRVKQIVGGTLGSDAASLRTNFVSDEPPAHFARLYREHALDGAHVIMLGPGNEAAAREALGAWPGGLQLGGGINAENAAAWIAAGASHVIVTSWLFTAGGEFQPSRLAALVAAAGAQRLVIDLSCRRTARGWNVAMNRWQTPTDMDVTLDVLARLAPSCAEFLIHAADVEGRMAGMDEDLLRLLGRFDGPRITYAGGARSMADLALAEELTGGRVDVTIGSALDIFGGSGVRFADAVGWNARLA